jgi:hypothetical protein
MKNEAPLTYPTSDKFTDSYIETALWSSTDESTPSGGDPLDKNYSGKDLDSKALQQIIETCQTFKRKNADALADAIHRSGYDYEWAGDDFWRTRNGHPEGYWNRDALEAWGLGFKLTNAARACGKSVIYVGDDGKLHVNEGVKGGGERRKTYRCDSCGRVSTSMLGNDLSGCCGKATQVLFEDAVEIPIPKTELGTDFIAVVHRGKVVDILLASDRSLINVGRDLTQRAQEYIHRGKSGEVQKTKDIEVQDGNNTYLVRPVNGVPHILVRVDQSDVYASGDGLFSPYERERIIKMALGWDRGNTGTCDQLSTGGQRQAIKAIGESRGRRTSKAGLRHKFDQCRSAAKRIIELVLGRKTRKKAPQG